MQLTIDKTGKRRLSLNKLERRQLESAVPVLNSLENVTSDCRVRTAARTIVDVVGEIDATGDVTAVRDEAQPQVAQPTGQNGNGRPLAEDEPFVIQEGSIEELSRLYVLLAHRKRELDAAVKENAVRLSAVAEPLCEQMALAGMQRLNRDGMTVFLATERYVSKKADITMEAACTLLERWGMGYMVADAYNASSLKSKVVEMLNGDEPLPDGFTEAFNVAEKTVVRSRVSD